jgi:hypothetical protein
VRVIYYKHVFLGQLDLKKIFLNKKIKNIFNSRPSNYYGNMQNQLPKGLQRFNGTSYNNNNRRKFGQNRVDARLHFRRR